MKVSIPALGFGLGLALVLGLASNPAAQKKTTTTCGADVFLNVQVNSTSGLISDGGGDYNHGSSRGLVARFQVENCTHDFTLITGNSRKMIAQLSGGRDVDAVFFNIDRVHSVPETPGALFTQEAKDAWLGSPFCVNGVQRTADGKIIKNGDGTYQDNYAGCGIDELGEGYVLRKMGVTLNPDSRLSFNISAIDEPNHCPVGNTKPACDASFVRVYHPSATRWIVKADAGAIASYTVWGKGAYVFKGYEYVPLEIIADRQ